MPRPRGSVPVGIVVTSAKSCAKYGMTQDDWVEMLRRQGFVCRLCLRVPDSGKFVVDHVHVKKWKRMRPVDRRRFVRGVICYWCNGKVCTRYMTLEKAVRVVEYLAEYRDRIAAEFMNLIGGEECPDSSSMSSSGGDAPGATFPRPGPGCVTSGGRSRRT